MLAHWQKRTKGILYRVGALPHNTSASRLALTSARETVIRASAHEMPQISRLLVTSQLLVTWRRLVLLLAVAA